MIAVRELNTKIVAVPNPYYDLLLIDTIGAKDAVKKEVQVDQQINILVDTAPRIGTDGTRFRVMTLYGISHEILGYDFLTSKDVPTPLLKVFDRALLKIQNEVALPLDDWAQIKAELNANV